MRAAFALLVSLTLGYVLLSRRRFDLFAVAAISAAVYFLPGLFGYALMPTMMQGHGLEEPLLDETYLVMGSVMAAILVGALAYDARAVRPIERPARTTPSALAVTAALSLGGAAMMIVKFGVVLLDPDKAAMMEAMGDDRWNLLATTAAVIGVVQAQVYRKPAWTLPFLAVLGLDVFMGFRTSLAIALICAFVWRMRGQSVRAIVEHRWAAIAAVPFALFLFAYKRIFGLVKLGDWDAILDLASEPDFYIDAVAQSEPFTTQVILNEAIARDFTVPPSHLLDVGSQFIVFAPELGWQLTGFNDFFQPVLFPQATNWGMANNIWAEMWCTGGWLMLGLFVVGFVAVLWWGSERLERWSDDATPLLLVGGAYWAFYTHRNDLLFQVNLEKRVVLTWLMSIVGARVIDSLVSLSRPPSVPRAAGLDVKGRRSPAVLAEEN